MKLIILLTIAISLVAGAEEILKKRCPVCYMDSILLDVANYMDPVYGGRNSWIRFKCFYGTFATLIPCPEGDNRYACYINEFTSHYYSEYRPTIRLAIEQWNYEVSPRPNPPRIKWAM